MDFKKYFKSLFFPIFFFSVTSLFAQTTIITGTVTDAGNKQTLPYVVVGFTGTTTGVTTDLNGKYRISTNNQTYKQLKISFLGYKDAFLTVVPGKEQVINVKLFPAAQQLNEFTIKSGKKPKYRNKDNPAVELIRKVIENKEKNRPEAYSYVEYREYDKMMFGAANVSAQFSDRKFFRKYKFVLDNRDSTSIPGKSIMPIFLNEKLVQTYYRKDPEKTRELVLGEKNVDFGPAV
ncbi:MAG TPA: carboxypeptidase-like regulatory domain-containing protein, partial [Mucilaginibacter sp.]